MSEELEERLRTYLRDIDLPPAPEALWSGPPRLDAAGRQRRASHAAGLVGVMGAVVILVLVVMRAGGTTTPGPASSLQLGQGVGAPPTLTVSEVLNGRAAGTIHGEQIVIAGFWSQLIIAHSCGVPDEPLGELESQTCHELEFGITERDEPILVAVADGTFRSATGPHLTPWFPPKFASVLLASTLTTDKGNVPVPITVVGHFDDPRAADCRPTAREACANRFVIEDVLSIGP